MINQKPDTIFFTSEKLKGLAGLIACTIFIMHSLRKIPIYFSQLVHKNRTRSPTMN